MKQKLFLWLLFGFLLLVGCSQAESAGEETAVPAPPTAENTPQPAPTPSPAATRTAAPTATSEPSPSPDEAAASTAAPNSPDFTTSEDGKVYLGDRLLLDIQADAPGCYFDIAPEIIISPTEAHFLLIPACLEGDNQAFLFHADGNARQQITGPFDYVNFLNVEWAADGQTFTYERINSCCLAPWEIPADAPPRGLVQVDVASGEKVLIATPTPPNYPFQVFDVAEGDVLNLREGPGAANPIVGSIPSDGTGIFIVGAGEVVGESFWVPVTYQELAGWVNSAFLLRQP